MSSRMVGVVLLLAGSEVLGLALGEWYFGLFLKTVPPLAMSGFNSAAAHVAYLTYGALAGLAVFLWALLVVFLGRFFKGSSEKPAVPSKVAPPA